MDALYRTPLLDCFRRGEVAPDVRLLAAQGVLAPRAHEQLALLAWLTGDSDAGIRQAAERTLGRIPRPMLERFLARPDVPDELRTFFSDRGVTPSAASEVGDDAPLIDSEGDGEAEDAPTEDTAAPVVAQDTRRMATVQRLSMLTPTQKVKVAMRGTREERSVLIRDPAKLVALAVLSSPKLTEQEVEGFAKIPAISEDALRVIGTSRAWIKNYTVVQGLVFNPKTPVAISLGMVNRLVDRDIRTLSTDRNVPEPIRFAARKILQTAASRKR
ncbi:MAG: hypothetical protein AB1806_04330 [Acidobacteriota bacterium]